MLRSEYTTNLIGRELNWFIYNLPHGLWAFSFTSFAILLTRNDLLYMSSSYTFCVFITMTALEVAEGKIIEGTYDNLDLIAILIGFFSLFK